MSDKSQRRSQTRAAPTSTGAPRDPLDRLLEAIVAALVVLRLFVPPEGSVLGLTLWITQGWFAAALIWAWVRYRDSGSRVRFDMLDAGVAIVVAAHVISALRVVIFRDGNSRAALNMMWEWLALGVSFPLLRGFLREGIARRQWVSALLVLAFVVGGLGLWQHYVWYPSLTEKYQQMRTELDALKSEHGETDALARQTRLRALQKEFFDLQIPMEGPALRQWEDRLRGSSEPIGLFALANSLGGWLAVWLIAGVGVAVRLRRVSTENERAAVSGRSMALIALGLAVVAYCLLLTKSRTAWVGLMAGLGLWGALAVLARRGSQVSGATPPSEGGEPEKSRRRLALAGVVGITLLLTAIGVAAFSGGFDRRVISEAPKSLRYRIQYWIGAAAVVQEHPLLGVGPGNFRPHYLKHKLPEASEEIADPHNFLFDLWTSGGLLALVGLVLAIVGGVRAARASPSPSSRTDPASAGPAGAGTVAAFVILIATDVTFVSPDLGRTVSLAAAWIVVAWLLGRDLRRCEMSTACAAGAVAAMFVHLLGAGGIEMPAIVQTVLLMAALAAPGRIEAVSSTNGRAAALPFTAGALAVGLFAGCLFTAMAPDAQRDVLLSRGDAAASNAEAFYAQAAEADPFSPEPAERLADALLRHAETRDSSFVKAIEMQKVAIELDPHNGQRYRRLAQMQEAAFASTRETTFAEEAVESYRAAIARYPNFAPLRAEFAAALRKAGHREEFRAEAARAIELDDINRREGHADKILPDSVLKGLDESASSQLR